MVGKFFLWTIYSAFERDTKTQRNLTWLETLIFPKSIVKTTLEVFGQFSEETKSTRIQIL